MSSRPPDAPSERVAHPSDALLRRLAGALAPLPDMEGVLRAAVDTTVELLDAVAGAVLLPAPDGTHVRIGYARNYSPELVRQLEQLPMERLPGADRLIRQRLPLFFDTHEALQQVLPGNLPVTPAGMRAAIPLVAGDRLRGVLFITFPVARRLAATDRELLEAVGQQCAVAMDRALLFERERAARQDAQDVAATLAESLDRMTDMHFIADEEWTYVRLNTAMRTYLARAGVDPEGLQGRSMWDLFPRLEGGPMHRAMLESRRTGRAVPFMATGVYLNSRYRGHAYPVHGGTAVMVQDTTDQERVQFGDRLLAESGAAFAASSDVAQTITQLAQRLVPGLADILIVFVRRDGGSVGVVALESTADEARQGLAAFDQRFPIDATPWHPIWTPLNEGRSVLTGDTATLLAARGESETAGEIARLVEATGTTSVIMVPLQARGHVLGALGMGTRGDRPRFDAMDLALVERIGHLAALALDNARLLQAEHRARHDAEHARSAAERASDAKSDFLAMMSHELRTPLNAISGYAELIEMGLRGPVTAEQVVDLQKIRRNQRHLLGIINSVLTFVRLNAGRVMYDVTTFPLAACMGSIESLAEPQLRARALRYTCHLAEPQLTLRADAERVQQVLLNLLDNAIKFTPEGGTIDMRAEVGEGVARIVLQDTGPGIPPERINDIFEPFVQAGTEAARQQGVGLGLAIGRELARGMGGDLVALADRGTGATFVLTLPRGPDRLPNA